MQEFSLEKYLQNPDRKIVTREGESVRIICTDKNDGARKIVALVRDKNGKEDTYSYTTHGRFWNNKRSDWDLMFVPIKQVGWVNVYRHPDLEVCIYSTREEAIAQGKIQEGYLATTQIEWEE